AHFHAQSPQDRPDDPADGAGIVDDQRTHVRLPCAYGVRSTEYPVHRTEYVLSSGPLVPKLLFGNGCLRNSVSRFRAGRPKRSFGKTAFPNRSLGTRDKTWSRNGPYESHFY